MCDRQAPRRGSAHVKGALRSFREHILGQHRFILLYFCLHVVDPATLLASNSVLGTLFSSENSLFIQLWEYIYTYISEFVLLH